MWIPWLPADKVLIPQDGISPWLLCALLVGFAAFSSVRLDQMGFAWLRFVSASVQGYIVGHLVVFDTSTLFARSSFAAFLGMANAIDRMSTIMAFQRAVRDASGEAQVGASGTLNKDGRSLAVEVKNVSGSQLTVYLKDRPYIFSNNLKVDHQDPQLQLTAPPPERVSAIAKELSSPGFQLRPWGYALGVCMAQWVIAGFGTADSFVAGMVTQDALIILCTPITFALLWYVATSYDDGSIKCICLLVFIGLCTLNIAAFVPMLLGFASFAVVQLVAHQVVAFVAIPCDAFLFLKLWDPSAQDLAKVGLLHILMSGERLLMSQDPGAPVAIGTENLRAALLA